MYDGALIGLWRARSQPPSLFGRANHTPSSMYFERWQIHLMTHFGRIQVHALIIFRTSKRSGVRAYFARRPVPFPYFARSAKRFFCDVLGAVTGAAGLRPLRPGPPLGAPFWVEQGGDDSFRSSQGWLWTDLDEYASDAHCMHTPRTVFSKK